MVFPSESIVESTLVPFITDSPARYDFHKRSFRDLLAWLMLLYLETKQA
jgi:hypothetical protein